MADTAQRRIARNNVKKALDGAAEAAVCEVFNSVFPLAARAAPHGSIHNYERWLIDAFKKVIEHREGVTAQMRSDAADARRARRLSRFSG